MNRKITYMLAPELQLTIEPKDFDTVITLSDTRILSLDVPKVPDAIFNIPPARWSAIDCKPELPGCYIVRGTARRLIGSNDTFLAYRPAYWDGCKWRIAHGLISRPPQFKYPMACFSAHSIEWAGCPEDFSVEFQQLLS